MRAERQSLLRGLFVPRDNRRLYRDKIFPTSRNCSLLTRVWSFPSPLGCSSDAELECLHEAGKKYNIFLIYNKPGFGNRGPFEINGWPVFRLGPREILMEFHATRIVP